MAPMSLFDQLFNKKKELRGNEISMLLSTLSALHEPVIVKTETFKFVTDILAFDQQVFQLKNTLTRDEVVYQLKSRALTVLIPYELTLYGGESRLVGLGMVGGVHTLKLAAPELMVQQESRGAYRVTRFPELPVVTFTTDNFDIVKCRLADLSMTGAGLRLDPRWERGNSKLTVRTSIILDIRLTPELRISTTATVRYAKGYKCGVQFDELSKGLKDNLFKFIVEQRREEQRSLIRIQTRIPAPGQPAETPTAPVAEEQPKGKPSALVVGDRQEALDFLTATLTRQFDVLYSSSSVTDIRNHFELKPSLCLLELREDNQDQVVQMRKVSALAPSSCVLMYYGRAISPGLIQRFEKPAEAFITLDEAKKLLVFKQIQSYYSQRAR